MKAKWVLIVAGLVVPVLILTAGYQPAIAKPTGEVKTAASMLGHEVPIPRFELSHANDWLRLVYDHLVGTNPDGKLSTERGVADKWQMTPDGLTWTFHIRKGITFHNGAELTAKDVKFSIDQVMLPDSTCQYAGNIRNALKSVEVKDPYTVIIHCKTPSIFLPRQSYL